ncbi:acyl-CoA dehydrogenase family protein [Micromonospora sp. NPDC005087]|uniref:acyl-CoA dehydrogenase family protein n=1 Tax=Micromonospora sp. NPDC005087 TaxID=3364225 RepID=UPI003677CF24
MATPSVSDLRDQVRTWLGRTEVPRLSGEAGERFAQQREWQRRLYDAGLLGAAWPVEFGGRGLTALHQVAVTTELVRHHAPPPVGEIGLEIVGPTILTFGSDEQRAELLPRILSGEDIWCQGFSEPEAGSDLASLRTTAVESGEVFIVNGQKTWSSYAKHATKCALLARTDPAASPQHRGISYLLIDLHLDGIEVRPIVQLTGADEFAEIFFTDVAVPISALLGERNRGWHYTMHTMSHERGPYVLKRQAELALMFDAVVTALAGQPGADRWAAEIGRQRVVLDALSAQSDRTADRLARGVGPAAEDSVDKLALTAADQSLTGAFATLAAGSRTVPSGRPHGLDAGRLTEDYYFGRASSIYGGTGQIQRNIVAERLLGLPKG